MRQRRVVGHLVVAIALMAGGCSSSDSASSTTEVAEADTGTVATTSTTTTVAPSTTTSSAVESTTTLVADADVLFADGFEMDEGWQYGIEVVFKGSSIDGSPGGCIPTAPPGTFNAVFVLTVTNLIDDRPSPYAPSIFKSNVTSDGSTLPDGGLFENSTGFLDAVEVFPNEAARLALCELDAAALAAGLGEIEAGGSVEFDVTVGPVEEDDIDKLELGIRFFGVGDGVLDAFMTTIPDSGEWVIED